MNRTEIKAAIAKDANIEIPTLMWVRQKDAAGVPQPWLSHWDNPSRTRISAHEDVLKKVTDKPTFNGLAFKKELVAAHDEVAAYTRYVLIVPTSVEQTW